jgi:hypothetical protein
MDTRYLGTNLTDFYGNGAPGTAQRSPAAEEAYYREHSPVRTGRRSQPGWLAIAAWIGVALIGAWFQSLAAS